MLTIAGALPEFAATVRDLDADPYLLNVANGTLDLRTMDLRKHDAADRITKVTRGAYDSQAPAPSWSAFLTRVLPDEWVRHKCSGSQAWRGWARSPSTFCRS